MFRNFPNGWWIFPSFLLGSVLWVILICSLVNLLFAPGSTELEGVALLIDR